MIWIFRYPVETKRREQPLIEKYLTTQNRTKHLDVYVK